MQGDELNLVAPLPAGVQAASAAGTVFYATGASSAVAENAARNVDDLPKIWSCMGNVTKVPDSTPALFSYSILSISLLTVSLPFRLLK